MPDRWGRVTGEDWMRMGSMAMGIHAQSQRNQQRGTEIADEKLFKKAYQQYSDGDEFTEDVPASMRDAAKLKSLQTAQASFDEAKKGANRYGTLAQSQINTGDTRRAAINLGRMSNYSSAPFSVKTFDMKKFAQESQEKGDGYYQAMVEGNPEVEALAASTPDGVVFSVVDNSSGQQQFFPADKENLNRFLGESNAFLNSGQAQKAHDGRIAWNKTQKEQPQRVNIKGKDYWHYMQRGVGNNVEHIYTDSGGKIIKRSGMGDVNALTIAEQKAKFDARKAEAQAVTAEDANVMGGKPPAMKESEVRQRVVKVNDLLANAKDGKLNPSDTATIKALLQNSGYKLDNVTETKDGFFWDTTKDYPVISPIDGRQAPAGVAQPGQPTQPGTEWVMQNGVPVQVPTGDLEAAEKEQARSAKTPATTRAVLDGGAAEAIQPAAPEAQQGGGMGGLGVREAGAAELPPGGAMGGGGQPEQAQPEEQGIIAALNDPKNPLAQDTDIANLISSGGQTSIDAIKYAAQQLSKVKSPPKMAGEYAMAVAGLIKDYFKMASESTQQGRQQMMGR